MPPLPIASEQGCEFIVLGLNPLSTGMFAWKETLLPALLMGFVDTDVPVAFTVLRALGWNCPVSLAHSALCLGQVSACLAQLAWPAAMLPLSSHSAAPEVSNTSMQQNP